MNIKIKYWPDAHKLEINPKGDWIDLYVYENTALKAGEFKYIPLGVAMELPLGYEGIMAPRSSTFKNWGIIQANSIGIFDNSFNGPDDQWMMPVYATRDVNIPKDTRLCQFRLFVNQQPVTFIEDSLEKNESRGGWGSSGL